MHALTGRKLILFDRVGPLNSSPYNVTEMITKDEMCNSSNIYHKRLKVYEGY